MLPTHYSYGAGCRAEPNDSGFEENDIVLVQGKVYAVRRGGGNKAWVVRYGGRRTRSDVCVLGRVHALHTYIYLAETCNEDARLSLVAL